MAGLSKGMGCITEGLGREVCTRFLQDLREAQDKLRKRITNTPNTCHYVISLNKEIISQPTLMTRAAGIRHQT